MPSPLLSLPVFCQIVEAVGVAFPVFAMLSEIWKPGLWGTAGSPQTNQVCSSGGEGERLCSKAHRPILGLPEFRATSFMV